MTKRSWPLAAFVVLQVLDGAVTYYGICMLGPEIEFNPLVGLSVWAWGAGLGLLSLKFPVVILGACMFLAGWRKTVLLLASLHFFAAVLPWLWAFHLARLFT